MGGGGRALDSPWEIMGLYVSLEIMLRTPLKKQLDPMGPMGPIASKEGSVQPFVKYVDD